MAKTKRRPDTRVTRREFTALTRLVEECVDNLALQFKRIAQIQAELDHIRAAWTNSESRKRR